jgi:aquaporin Z
VIKRLTAECAGTCWLVFVGCGCNLLAFGYPETEAGSFVQASAFGLAVMTLVYFLRPLSGAHFNPAVSVGFAVANRFPVRDLVPYTLAQLAGAFIAAALLFAIAAARPGFDVMLSDLGANGYGDHSPGNYRLSAALLVEVLLTCVFVLVNLAAEGKRRTRVGGPLMIGVTLTLAYLLSLPVTGGSLNPARSTGPALLVGGWALDQLWMFWAAPLVGGVLAGLVYPLFAVRPEAVPASPAGEGPP